MGIRYVGSSHLVQHEGGSEQTKPGQHETSILVVEFQIIRG
jgi:hypothetical protein